MQIYLYGNAFVHVSMWVYWQTNEKDENTKWFGSRLFYFFTAVKPKLIHQIYEACNNMHENEITTTATMFYSGNAERVSEMQSEKSAEASAFHETLVEI